jgi:predicted DNA-binding transcriptional regulator AlpA
MDHQIAIADTALDRGGVAAAVADPEPAGRPIPRDPDALLFGTEMAYLLGLSARTLENLRLKGGGPPYIKLGRAVRYNRLGGLEWANRQIRRSTSGAGGAAA